MSTLTPTPTRVRHAEPGRRSSPASAGTSQDLRRAAGALGVDVRRGRRSRAWSAASGTGPARVEAGGIDLTRVDGVLVRMMPPGSLEQVVFRMDALHRLAALGVPGPEPAAGGRGGGRQVPGAGPARRGRAAGPADLGRRVGRRGAGGVRGAGGRRRGQAALRLGGAGAGPRLATPSWPGGRSRRSSGSGPCSTSSGRSAIPATTSASSSWAAGSWGRSAAMRPAGDWRTNVAVGGRPEPCTLDAEVERLALARGRGRRGADGRGRPAARPRPGRPGRPRGQRRPRLAGPGRRRRGSTSPRRSWPT